MATRIANVNVNGVRAAYRKGMGDWLANRGVDILCLQEVRAETTDLEPLLGDGWHVAHDAATAKGRAGVAIASRQELLAVRTDFGAADFDSAGRWIEADFRIGSHTVTVVSVYVHSGEVDTPKQVEKYKFLDAMESRMSELGADGSFALVVGDLNVGHRTLDIKNWKGNLKNSGFLPEERAWLDELFGGMGLVDAFRVVNQNPDEYTWWSNRGQAWAKNVGWRIDYQITTPGIGATAKTAAIYKDQRFSDHAPLLMEYDHAF